MKNKKTQIKNARILTPKEMREIREIVPYIHCTFEGKMLECPSGTQDWQVIGDFPAEGIRCDNKILMCKGGEYLTSGNSNNDFSLFCPDPQKGILLKCNGDDSIDEIIYKEPYDPLDPIIAGIKCGNEYRFCYSGWYPGGESGSGSGSGSGWGSGSGSGSGSGPWKESDIFENGGQKNLL